SGEPNSPRSRGFGVDQLGAGARPGKLNPQHARAGQVLAGQVANRELAAAVTVVDDAGVSAGAADGDQIGRRPQQSGRDHDVEDVEAGPKVLVDLGVQVADVGVKDAGSLLILQVERQIASRRRLSNLVLDADSDRLVA